MSGKIRILLFGALVMLLALAGCAGAVSVPAPTNEAIGSTDVQRTLQYIVGRETGPAYDLSMTVPSDWVGNFQTRTAGNVIYFEYIDGDRAAPIFSIEALEREQYWKASGSYPASQTNLANKFDTYFVYHLPIDPHYSGLSAEQYATLAQQVQAVVATFNAAPAATQ